MVLCYLMAFGCSFVLLNMRSQINYLGSFLSPVSFQNENADYMICMCRLTMSTDRKEDFLSQPHAKVSKVLLWASQLLPSQDMT